MEGFRVAVLGLASTEYVGQRNINKPALANTFHLELA